MNVLSLCDGISCGQLALSNLGYKVENYFACEVDKNPILVTQNNFPNTIQLGDITKINLEELPKIDLLLAGTPCQGFSKNGNMLNFSDDRSKLYFDFSNILKWIKQHNNRDVKFLFENVDMKKEWIDIIDKDLGVNGVLINSDILLPQNRKRVYWTNIDYKIPSKIQTKLLDILECVNTDNFIKYKNILVDPLISEKSLSLIDVVNNEVRIKQATKKGYIVAESGDGVNLQFPTSKTRRGRVTKNRSATLDCGCDICVFYDNILRKFTINELEILQGLPVNYTSSIKSENNRKKAIGNGWSINIIESILRFLK